MSQKINQMIEQFQTEINELKQPDVILLSVGIDTDSDESIILKSSIENPKAVLNGLIQTCINEPGFYMLFKSAVTITDDIIDSQEGTSND